MSNWNRDDGALVLTHYFDSRTGPFRSLSDLPVDEARAMIIATAAVSEGILGQRNPEYLDRRLRLEQMARERFVALGGRPARTCPRYMIVGCSPWLSAWYSQPCSLTLSTADFAPDTLSFTYGDLFPTFGVKDGREYRGRLYTLDTIVELIGRLGLPQDWNPDGAGGPERYIEVQVWADPLPAAVVQHVGKDP